jgi:hypothetical protein
LASADSKAGKVAKLAKAKFPKVAKSGYGMCMSTSSMSVGPEPPITPSPTPTPTTLQPTPEPSLSLAPSSEPSLSSAPTSVVQLCGEIFTNQKVVLTDNLDCGSLVDPKDQEDCAVTLNGPEAEIDCQGNTLSQEATPQAFYSDGPYESGICLNDGATATNCNVEKFVDGIFVTEGGEVRNSFLTSNWFGIAALFTKDSTLTIEDT